jgi:hypothetical protein
VVADLRTAVAGQLIDPTAEFTVPVLGEDGVTQLRIGGNQPCQHAGTFMFHNYPANSGPGDPCACGETRLDVSGNEKPADHCRIRCGDGTIMYDGLSYGWSAVEPGDPT